MVQFGLSKKTRHSLAAISSTGGSEKLPRHTRSSRSNLPRRGRANPADRRDAERVPDIISSATYTWVGDTGTNEDSQHAEERGRVVSEIVCDYPERRPVASGRHFDPTVSSIGRRRQQRHV